MPHLPQLDWDYKDQLKEVTLNASKHKAYYTYDASGERVRKVIDKGSVVEERLYIGGFEIYRKTVSGTLDYERETLKITEGRNTIAQLETKTIENGNTISSPTTNQRFQYSNHLGSACLELDASGNIISYEEYHPFGTTSYRSGSSETEVSLKRYKYVGKERDEETGLYYYGARYYAAWIARFVSVDPLQFDYPYYTPYQYAGNKPITYIDLDGLEEFKLEFPNENKANTNININYRPKLKKIPDRIIKLEPIRGHVSSNSDSNIDIKMEKRERYIKKIEGNFYDDLILQKDVTDIVSSRTPTVDPIKKEESKNLAHSPLGNLIAKYESGDDYNIANQTKGGLKLVRDYELTKMTISEVMKLQEAKDIFAAGRYQLTPSTLKLAVSKLDISQKTIFNNATQDKIFSEYLIKTARPQAIDYLESDGSLSDAMYALAKEWASIGVEKGKSISKGRTAKGGESYYAGDGLNKAHITPSQIKNVLIQTKKNGNF